MEGLIKQLEGPIAVLGGTGFIGGNLVKKLSSVREDVYWGQRREVLDILKQKKPKTVFNCCGCGNHGFEIPLGEIFEANVWVAMEALDVAFGNECRVFIHAGSAAEYGDALLGPLEDQMLKPTSLYGASKAMASAILWYYGKTLGKKVANLRFYNVYGPGDNENRLIPTVIREGKRGKYPLFLRSTTMRDFVYIDDACRAFVLAALNLKEENYGEAFNIGGGIVTLGTVGYASQDIFKIENPPAFEKEKSGGYWCSDTGKAERILGFKSEVSFWEGFRRLASLA